MPLTDIEPLMPERAQLEDLAFSLVRASGAIGTSIAAQTRSAVSDVLRNASAHYSAAIDGHTPHPYHIDQASRSDLSSDPNVRALQREAIAHIRAQRLIEGRVAREPDLDICSTAFLRQMHWE